MGYPAHAARNREHDSEHRLWNAERLIDDPGVKVDVGVEVLFDEILVLERELLKA
jgi:hypothetical protein